MKDETQETSEKPAPEALADVAREILCAKNPNSDCTLIPNAWLSEWAYRIEAAAERERQDAMKTAMMAKCEVCERLNGTGDAAAMRGALEAVSEALYCGDIGAMGDCPQNHALETARKITELVDAALAAPARNCDVGTAEEQYRRFMTMCNSKDATQCSTCMFRQSCYTSRDKCFARWAQLPYAKREGGTDEQK